MHIEVVCGSPSIYRPCFTLPLSGYDLHVNFILMENFYFVLGELLVDGVVHLVLLSEVDPQLKTDRVFFSRSRNLGMHDSLACRHPLNITWADFTFVAFEIFVVEASFEHIGDSLEASVWVVGESRG
jgi:hypothetical protein